MLIFQCLIRCVIEMLFGMTVRFALVGTLLLSNSTVVTAISSIPKSLRFGLFHGLFSDTLFSVWLSLSVFCTSSFLDLNLGVRNNEKDILSHTDLFLLNSSEVCSC